MSTFHELSDTWQRTFPDLLPELLRALDQLETWLKGHQAPPEACYLARLAGEEMGTNIIKYGYDDNTPHEITLRATAGPDHFQLELIDDGHPFDPTARSEPSADLTLEERRPGGWGIALVRRMAAGVSYERKDDRNHLTILIARNPAPDAPSANSIES